MTCTIVHKHGRFAWCVVLVFIGLISGCFRIPHPDNPPAVASILAGYKVHRYSGDFIVIANNESLEDTPEVPRTVVAIGHDHEYIVAKQQSAGRDSTEKNQEQFQYWIINTSTHDIWGPLSTEELAAKRDELQVSPDLKLKDQYEYR